MNYTNTVNTTDSSTLALFMWTIFGAIIFGAKLFSYYATFALICLSPHGVRTALYPILVVTWYVVGRVVWKILELGKKCLALRG